MSFNNNNRNEMVKIIKGYLRLLSAEMDESDQIRHRLGEQEWPKLSKNELSASTPYISSATSSVNRLNTDNLIAMIDDSINNKRNRLTSSPKDYQLSQIFAALAVSMGALLMGFTHGYSSPAIFSMKTTLPITTEQERWVGSMMPLWAMAGGLAGAPLCAYFGRRRTIMATAPLFSLGWVIIAIASEVNTVLIGRAFCGLCMGLGSVAFPIYLSEVVQQEGRAVLGLLPFAFANVGVLFASLVGANCNWYQMAFFGTVLPVPFFILMLSTSDSPHWYITRGRVKEARESLQWLRGRYTNIEPELDDLTTAKAQSGCAGGSGIRELFRVQYGPAVLIAIGLMLFHQLNGINAVIFNALRIFCMTDSNIDMTLSSTILGFVNFVSTFIAIGLIERLGRKILLYLSSITMVFALVVLGSYFYAKKTGVDVSAFGMVPISCLTCHVLAFSIGFGPIPWLMLGEILPTKIRGNAVALATAVNWACNFFVTKEFPNIIDAIGMHGTVWLFSGLSLIGLIFVVFYVPETGGRSSEEILNNKIARAWYPVRNIKKKKHQENFNRLHV